MDRPLVPFGEPPAERADAARNRVLLLAAAREMIDELGVEKVTMDGLAERAGLGKGTVFRRFGTRAGIFRALLDHDEHALQARVLSGPPPLGPGADPVDRLIAYGRARIDFLVGRHQLARATLDRKAPIPAAGSPMFSRPHIRMLLTQARLGVPEVDSLSLQLTSALEGPLLLYLSADPAEDADRTAAGRALADSWQSLIERIARR
ncbi:helix-turn-helix domain-containing protein [Kitasatospora sp. NPDC049285]|uniref:TetR/AcrR family transcriptional regulator n=1 Tax=Kitasatospora sp. NPDC049285 TaxID=3157096 RepID=UPI0034289449